MRRIAILNQKGGVGKTTTAVNLAAALARLGERVCLIDLDPQAHATTHLGIEPDGEMPSIYDVLVRNRPLADVRRELGDAREQFSLVGADINLAAAEVELAGVVGREVILREAIERDRNRPPHPPREEERDRSPHAPREEERDRSPHAPREGFLLMDCGPSLGVLTLNALAATQEVFIPLQPHFFALHGLSKLLETTSLVSRRINPGLKVTGIIICLYEAATRLGQEVIREVMAFLEKSRGTNVPWADAKLLATRIRRNVKLAEAPSHGQTIFEYAPTCAGAIDYLALAQEVSGIAISERETEAAAA